MNEQLQNQQGEQADSLTVSRKIGKSVWCLAGVVVIVTVVSFFLTHLETSTQAITRSVPLSKLSPDQELSRILAGKNIDLALANWLMAAEIPEFQDLPRSVYFEKLDAMTEQVRWDLEKMQAAGYAGTDPNNPQTLCQRFCSAIIGLHLSYAEEFRAENLTAAQMAKLYANPDDIFLAGLLLTRRGSCVSMPLIYLVIGQRLGMPVHLVAIGRHYFVRWEEPGYRINIETTSVEKIATTPDDSVYLDAEGLTHSQLSGSDLRNLTSREVVGELFFTRTSYWHGKGSKYQAQSREDLVSAHQLAPDDPAIKTLFQAVIKPR